MTFAARCAKRFDIGAIDKKKIDRPSIRDEIGMIIRFAMRAIGEAILKYNETNGHVPSQAAIETERAVVRYTLILSAIVRLANAAPFTTPGANNFCIFGEIITDLPVV